MTSQIVSCRTVTLVLLIGMVGCRKSDKTASLAPTASPTPVALVTQAGPTPSQPPAQAEAALSSPIQVKPPASFNANQLPEGRVEFILAGSAGQFLLMNETARSHPHPPPSRDMAQRQLVFSLQMSQNQSKSDRV